MKNSIQLHTGNFTWYLSYLYSTFPLRSSSYVNPLSLCLSYLDLLPGFWLFNFLANSTIMRTRNILFFKNPVILRWILRALTNALSIHFKVGNGGLQDITHTPTISYFPEMVNKNNKLTFVEFLLGAVMGQSGSSGFRQGLSIYPCPTSALFSISSQVSTCEFIFFNSSKNSRGSKLVHCKWGFPL